MNPPVEPIYTRLGAWVRFQRRCAGLTQEKLGLAVGLSREGIAAIEGGKQRVAIHQFIEIEKALGPVPVRLARVG